MTKSLDARHDVISRLGPHKGLGIGVVVVEVLANGALELAGGAMGAAAELALGQSGEPTLDLVEPRSRSRCEVDVESWMTCEPGAHPGGLVRSVIEQRVEGFGIPTSFRSILTTPAAHACFGMICSFGPAISSVQNRIFTSTIRWPIFASGASSFREVAMLDSSLCRAIQLRNPEVLVGLQAQPPRWMLLAVVDCALRVALTIQTIHRLQKKMSKAESFESFWHRTLLREDQLQLISCGQNDWGTSFRANADPVEPVRR